MSDDDSSCVSSDDLADHRGSSFCSKSGAKGKIEGKTIASQVEDEPRMVEIAEKVASGGMASLIVPKDGDAKDSKQTNTNSTMSLEKDTRNAQNQDVMIKREESGDSPKIKTEEWEKTSADACSGGEKEIERSDDEGLSNEEKLKRRLASIDEKTRVAAAEMIANLKQLSRNEALKSRDQDSEPKSAKKAKKDDPKVKPKNPRNSNAGKHPLPSTSALKHCAPHSDQLRSTQFPFRLHNMLDDAVACGHADIVSWCKGGESFKIHDPKKLIKVLKKYFRQSKFKSFLRQLQGYNFKRVTRGKDQGVVSHPLFIQGRRSLSTYMKRKRVGPKPEEGGASGVDLSKSGMTIGPDATPKVKNEATNKEIQAALQGFSQGVKDMKTDPTDARQVTNQAAGRVSTGPMHFKDITIPINPEPHDVLCVDVPNVQHFHGNRKLSSIIKKIVAHYTSGNESVKTMIVKEIATRIQKGGSRFLRLNDEGTSWMECTREEVCRKIFNCFEVEIKLAVTQSASSLPMGGNTGSIELSKTTESLSRVRNSPPFPGVMKVENPRRHEPPREHDVVLRGGPCSEKEGNKYLITMIQANVGQQVDSLEMKRIKCRAILERMKRRGSRFFLKLKDTDPDDEMYILSDAEAQDVIYTAFCAEEKKVQSLIVDTSSASSMLHRPTLVGMDAPHPSLAALGGAASQFSSARAVPLRSDTALLNQLRATNEIGLLSSQGSLKRPLESQGHFSHKDILEKRLRAETDEHVQLLLERARSHRGDPYGASNLMGRLPLQTPARSSMLESVMPPAAFAGTSIEQLLKERQADEYLKSAVARGQLSAGAVAAAAAGLGAELPKSNSNFVEFLKKKYVNGGQGGPW